MSDFLTKKAFEIWVKNHLSNSLTGGGGGVTSTAKHGPTHEYLGSDAINILHAAVIVLGIINGDRLPAISTTKKGAVPAVTPQATPHFLRDTGGFEHIVQNDVSGLETTATPEFSGLGIETAGSLNKINLIEGAQIGIATGPRQVFNDAGKLLELLDADVNIGDTPMQPGTGGTWSTSYDSAATIIYCQAVYLGKFYVGASNGNVYVYDGATWVLSYDSPSSEIYSLCVFNGKLYAGGLRSGDATPKHIYVFDGSTWGTSFASTSGTIPQCFALCVLGNTLYAGFREGSFSSPGAADVIKTTNGTTWTVSKGWDQSYPHALTVFDGMLYAAGEADGIWRLVAGSWVQVDTTAIFWRALYAWNNKIYAGGASGKIFVSSDGTVWTEAADLGVGIVYSFTEYNGKLLAAYDDKIYETSNGTDWTLFYDSAEAAIYSLILYGNNLFAGTGSAGKVLVYIDNTYVPAPNLQLFGHETIWGQLRPGDAAGVKGSLLLSDAPNYNKWLPPGTDQMYLAAPATPGDDPVYQVIPASDVVNTPAGAIAAVTVQAAIDELDTEKQSIAGMNAAVAASFQAAVISHLVCHNGNLVIHNGEVVYHV